MYNVWATFPSAPTETRTIFVRDNRDCRRLLPISKSAMRSSMATAPSTFRVTPNVPTPPRSVSSNLVKENIPKFQAVPAARA